ncbi:hypothetical protein [Labedaea rhizosphaerae]|uniref:Uncharacterized protein n=1 Tax=Labedaea rhizosphaerae TaxID=598644 RepID=A0A4R6SGD9_LABRH|nr:hypothetical protein [Labedaea rhizosphaerae]TDQ00713.1 hypothetical protein EV186_102579 [Labedaea rhizosphaerae]
MADDLVFTTVFELFVAVGGTVVTTVLALFYLRRVRLERPAVGVFNGRDIAVLLCVLALLPTLYVVLAHWALTTFLAITFMASLSIGYRPVVRNQGLLWAGIGLLLGANIWMARTMLGTVLGWQLYWVETSVIVVLGACAVANLYVQGGMRLKHVARFALLLAVYDLVFTAVTPLTNELAQDFLGYPLDPSFGFRLGLFNATLGLGDLLIYSLFVAAAFKAYGRSAARFAMVVVVVFGAVIPATAPLLINFIDARADVVVPAQTFFGPGAFAAYLWLRHRYGRERTMKEFLASDDVVHAVVAATPAVAVEPVPAAPAAASAAIVD